MAIVPTIVALIWSLSVFNQLILVHSPTLLSLLLPLVAVLITTIFIRAFSPAIAPVLVIVALSVVLLLVFILILALTISKAWILVKKRLWRLALVTEQVLCLILLGHLLKLSAEFFVFFYLNCLFLKVLINKEYLTLNLRNSPIFK